MNETITLKVLTHLLANATERPNDVVEQFVTQFFALIEETLSVGESVTIKSLGTFHNRNGVVVFDADSALADAVNAPFSAFGAIALNDDELAEPEAEPADDEPAQQIVIDHVETIDLSAEEPVEDVPVEEEPAEEEPVVEEQGEEKPAVEEPVVEEPVVEEQTEEEVAEEEPVAEEEHVARTLEVAEPQIVHHYHHRRALSVTAGILIFVAGLIVGIAIGYFLKDRISTVANDNSLSTKPNLVIDADTVTIVQPKSVYVEKQTEPKSDTTHTDTLAKAKTVAEKPAVQAAPETKAKAPRYDTVNGKVYLATLARKYYGKAEYWVYIYDANKLRHPDRIKPGTRLLIPYIEDVRTSPDDSTNLAQAKRRASQIYASCGK